MRRDAHLTLSGLLRAGDAPDARAFLGATRSVSMMAAARACCAGARGKNVMLAVREQFDAALALIALDGVAARIVVCAPGLPDEHRATIAAKAAVDCIIDDEWIAAHPFVEDEDRGEPLETEWLLLTSGTTGSPKLVSHDLRGLTGAIAPPPSAGAPSVWATFYDIRRYGGLQIYLRGVLGVGSLVIAGADEALPDLLYRCGGRGVTHMSGTPSHWRRVLMHPVVPGFAPQTVRLSGEIADQAVLDALRERFPHAKIGHAYASTEAGVGFEVNDSLEGFPASYVEDGIGPVAMKIENDTLRIRSARTAADYVGEDIALRDADGFVDTGDIVQRRGERFYFVGRQGGIINVGGQKAHPEEIEAVINRHSAVRMSLVKSRRNPITGAVIAAEIVLREACGPDDVVAIGHEIEATCRDSLPAWKVPATIRFVPSLAMTPAGKLARHA